MLEITTDNAIILDFLSKYPESQRHACAEAVLIYGIRTIKSKFPYGLAAPQLLSVSGLNLESLQKSLFVNSSMSNRSLDFSKVAQVFSKNEEVTEQLRKNRWSDLEVKPLANSEKKRGNNNSSVKTPNKRNYDKIQDDKGETFEREYEVMKIADNFLKSNYFAFLNNEDR